MNDALLYLCLWKYSFDCLWKSCQSIHTCDQNIFKPTIFSPLMIESQNLACAIYHPYIPRTSFLPSMLTPKSDIKQHVLQFGLHFAHDSGLHPYKQLYIDFFQGLSPILLRSEKDLICNPADRTV